MVAELDSDTVTVEEAVEVSVALIDEICVVVIVLDMVLLCVEVSVWVGVDDTEFDIDELTELEADVVISQTLDFVNFSKAFWAASGCLNSKGTNKPKHILTWILGNQDAFKLVSFHRLSFSYELIRNNVWVYDTHVQFSMFGRAAIHVFQRFNVFR